MGYREFKADLAAAKSSNYDRISRLRGGELEGEITFLYEHDEPLCQVEIQVIIQDVENYPNSRAVLLFTVSEDVDKGFIDRLQRMTPHLVQKSIHEAMTEFSRQMATSKGGSPAKVPTGAISPDSEDELTPSLQSEPWDLSDLESDADEDMYTGLRLSTKRETEDYSPVAIHQRDATDQQRKDLLQAMHRGFSIGVNGRRQNQLGDIFSLAVKVSELGLTDNGLAWGLKPTDYVVMLLKFPQGYPSPSEYQSLRGKQSVALVRFGKCSFAKPSNVSAQAAFHNDAKGKAPVRHAAYDSAAFIPLYLFNPITNILNEYLPALLQTRRDLSISWSEAQILHHRQSEGSHIRDDAYRSTTEDHAAELKDKLPSATPTHWVLSQDDALVHENQLSIPLILMQFALQSVMKSGKFCINCHEHLEEGFEAMKPYVCSRPLCLHQYYSSGLGPGIEHDILTAPYVVDLVISFFYAAVMSRRIRELPIGLGLKTFRPGTPESPRQNHEATACFVTRAAKCDFPYPGFRKGERLLMVVRDEKLLPGYPILKSLAEKHLCEVTDVSMLGFDFNILQTWSASLGDLVESQHQKSWGGAPPKRKWRSVYVYRCVNEFDNLRESERHDALLIMTCGIPPVTKMREFLLANPSQKLSSWSHLDHPTYKLLHWIVASNRSLIVYDDHGRGLETPGGTKVIGMEEGWMQFRFLQGSPEKEIRFMEQIASAFPEDPASPSTAIPTLFAFHGSPLGNWHSIIRSSLDHTQRENGRAYGKGVYLSNRFDTSIQYCRPKNDMGFNPIVDEYWPRSVLKVASAIAICEVINRPAQFVSMVPHYVVEDIDWIQCRYLFVKVGDSVPRIDTPIVSQNSLGYLRQDPARKLHGKLEILIPTSAIPVSRLKMFPHLAARSLPSDWTNDPGLPSEWTNDPGSQKESEAFQGEDLDGLLDSADDMIE
ncbi:unnamed protein product [Clonostachys byssicola]|uniref:PARP catalytic domain-containing protein n=1 Tax=Clonostachys byssicola TaxID=160290 RepID=A0A9N9TZM8_9HYPO|nr:unnamed protein product [Clonostachys byssicola]